MKKMLLLPVLAAALSACGTGLIPPITRDVPDIRVTLPSDSSALPGVVYLSTNQFDKVSGIASVVSSVEATGDLTYTSGSGLTNLSSVGIYIRANLDGANCSNLGGYLLCGGDESANKLQDLAISKGVTVKTTLAGTLLNRAIQTQTGYIGFRINTGSTLKGDQIRIENIKATIRF